MKIKIVSLKLLAVIFAMLIVHATRAPSCCNSAKRYNCKRTHEMKLL